MLMLVLDLCHLARVYLAVTHHLGGFTYTMAAEMLWPTTKRQQPKARSQNTSFHSSAPGQKTKVTKSQNKGLDLLRVVIQSLSRLKITS